VLRAEIELELDDFSLDVRFSMQNEVLALLGPSGAGKTLTIASIAGLQHPQRGRIEFDGDIWFDSATRRRVRPQNRGVGIVFQNYALFPHLSVRQNVAFGLKRVPEGERRQRVRRLLEEMRLEGLEERRPQELSGGQQQRVALARALAPRPRILLLDEPFAAVDATVRMRLLDLVREVHETHRIPIVLITHAIEEAYALADRMAVLEQGKLLQIGPTDEVFRRPVSHRVARIVGTRNILNGTVVDRVAEETRRTAETRKAAAREMRPSGSRVRTEGGLELEIAEPYPVGTPITLCMRPSRLDVVTATGAVRGERRTAIGLVAARVERVQSTGDRYELLLQPTPHGERLEVELSADAFARRRVEPGGEVRVAISHDAVHSFRNEYPAQRLEDARAL